MSIFDWFKKVQKFTLKINHPGVAEAVIKTKLFDFCKIGTPYATISPDQIADKDFRLFILEWQQKNKQPYDIIKQLLDMTWIQGDWIAFFDWYRAHILSRRSYFLFRGISNFDGESWKRLLETGNDAYVQDGRPIPHKRVQTTGLKPSEFIWADYHLDKAWEYACGLTAFAGICDSTSVLKGRRTIALCIYDRRLLEHQYPFIWKLAPGVKSFKDALIATIIITYPA